MRQDHYTVLGLAYNASAEEIRKAYFEMVRRYHPDTSGRPDTTEQFLKIQAAYEVLSNPRQKAEYDAENTSSTQQAPAIHIDIRASREEIQVTREPQVLYTLLDVATTAQFDPQRKPPIHVCLVIDRSTSMAGARLDMVKTNIGQAIAMLKPEDMISVIAFSDRAEVVVPPTPIAHLARGDTRISTIRAGGGTEIFSGLNLGMNILQTGSELLADRHLILLTDGHTYGDEPACIDLAERAGEQGVTISAFGLGSEWHDQFLDRLTAASGGNTAFVRSSDDLSRFLKEKIKTAGQAYARSLSLDLQLDERVELQYAFRIKPNITPLPLEFPLPLGSLLYDKNVSVLLEFRIAAMPEPQEVFNLFRGCIHLEIFDPAPHVTRAPVTYCCPVSVTAEYAEVHPTIMDALSRLTLYRMQEQAAASVESGDYQTAVYRMKNLATQLFSRGENELAHTVMAEVQHLLFDHALTPEGNKRIKYGTRSLLLPGVSEVGQ